MCLPHSTEKENQNKRDALQLNHETECSPSTLLNETDMKTLPNNKILLSHWTTTEEPSNRTTTNGKSCLALVLDNIKEEIQQISTRDWALLVVAGGLGAAAGFAGGGVVLGGVVCGVFSAVIGAYVGVLCVDLIQEACSVFKTKLKSVAQCISKKYSLNKQ